MWGLTAVALTAGFRVQAKDWADQDVGKVHKSRLEREKEAAAAARSATSCIYLPQMSKNLGVRGTGQEQPWLLNVLTRQPQFTCFCRA